MSEKVLCSRCGCKVSRKRAVEGEKAGEYVCRSCFEKEERKKSWFYQNSPLVFGLLFIIGGLGAIGRGNAYVFRFAFGERATVGVCLVVGAALLTWYVYEKIKKARRRDS